MWIAGLGALCGIVLAAAAQAGTVATVGDNESECAYIFSGPIVEGDAEKIAVLNTYGSAGATLCFDSPGGSMLEGLRIFDVIWNRQMRTRVLDGHRCESACAIAWLGGSESHGTLAFKDLSRSIQPGAILGFHAPSLELPDDDTYSAAQVEQAFQIALQAAEGIFRINLLDQDSGDPLNNYVYGRILATPGDQMHRITTVGEALLANVRVEGARGPQQITHANMIHLCENAYLLSRGVNSDMGGADTYLERLREFAEEGDRVQLINGEVWAIRLDGQRRRQYGCMLNDERLARLEVTLFYVHVWPDRPAEEVWAELREGRAVETEEFTMPSYALYDANTPLNSLPRR